MSSISHNREDTDTKPAATKKRRIKNSAARDGDDSNLPAELWANVLGYLYFDEVLTCTMVNKSFCYDVPKFLDHLCIRSGKSMAISYDIFDRFVRVKDVFIYLIQESLHDKGYYEYHFDIEAASRAAWFLSNMPNLKWAFLGGEANWHRNMIRHGVVYDVNEDLNFVGKYDPNYTYGAMIHDFCDAYRRGDISRNVDIEGLLPIQGPPYCHGRCAWKKKAPQVSRTQWRTDVACQTCDMICMSYPPAKVLMLTDMEVPCIETGNRMIISKQRDERNFEKNLTDALVAVVESHLYDTIMLPPKYDTQKGFALSYKDYQYDMMETLVDLGANTKDPRIFQAIMRDVSKNDSPYIRNFDTLRVGQTVENRHKPMTEPPCTPFHDSKRIIKQTTFNKLNDIGFRLKQENFSIIDSSDRRTRVIRDDLRKMRDKLDSADSVHDVEEVVTWLRGMVRYHSHSPDIVINTLEHELSAKFTPQRRGELKELFQELCEE